MIISNLPVGCRAFSSATVLPIHQLITRFESRSSSEYQHYRHAKQGSHVYAAALKPLAITQLGVEGSLIHTRGCTRAKRQILWKHNTRHTNVLFLPKLLFGDDYLFGPVPPWLNVLRFHEAGGSRDSLRLRPHPPSWHRSQRVQLNTHHIHEFVRSVPSQKNTFPLQKQEETVPASRIRVSQNQFWLCLKFRRRRLFLLNDNNDAREFLIGTGKLEWADMIWTRWRNTNMLTRPAFKETVLQHAYIRCFRKLSLTSVALKKQVFLM